MVFKLVQKQKRDIDLNKLSYKIVTENAILANFSKFHKMVLFETEKGLFSPKNRVGKGNELFYQIFIKKGKKGKRGMIYLDFFENLNFEIFGQFLAKIQIYPFWYPFYPFSGRGKKVLHFGHITHKYRSNRPNSKKFMRSSNFDIQKTTNFVHKSWS